MGYRYLQSLAVCVLALGAAAAPRPALTEFGYRSQPDNTPEGRNGSSSVQTRVEGGVPVAPGELYYACTLRYLGADICSGSIINLNHVLTAARCVEFLPGATGLTIAAGSNMVGTGTVFAADEITIHPKYDKVNMKNDAAVIHTVDPLQGEQIRKVDLPPAGQTLDVGSRVIVSGYGINTPPIFPPPPPPMVPPAPPAPPVEFASPILLKAELQTTSQDRCMMNYKGTPVSIDSSTVCAAAPVPAGACIGDWGSALVQQSPGGTIFNQYGITSTAFGCGNSKYPNVFTSVTHPDIRNFVFKSAGV